MTSLRYAVHTEFHYLYGCKKNITVTASICCSHYIQKFHEYFHNADKALYRDYRHGFHNTVHTGFLCLGIMKRGVGVEWYEKRYACEG